MLASSEQAQGTLLVLVPALPLPLPSASIHTKRPQIERTFVGAGVRDVGDLAMSDDDETHL